MSEFNVRREVGARDVAGLVMQELALGHEHEQDVLEAAEAFIKRQRNRCKPNCVFIPSDWETIIRNTKVYCKVFILEEF